MENDKRKKIDAWVLEVSKMKVNPDLLIINGELFDEALKTQPAYKLRENEYARTKENKDGVCWNFCLATSAVFSEFMEDKDHCIAALSNSKDRRSDLLYSIVLYKYEGKCYALDPMALVNKRTMLEERGIDFSLPQIQEVFIEKEGRLTLEEYLMQTDYQSCHIYASIENNNELLQNPQPATHSKFFESLNDYDKVIMYRFLLGKLEKKEIKPLLVDKEVDELLVKISEIEQMIATKEEKLSTKMQNENDK